MCGRIKKSIISMLMAVILLVCGTAGNAFLLSVHAESQDKAARTILFYGCGSDLEDEEGGFLSRNLRQILEAKIRPDTHVIIMTGGSGSWELEPEYLDGADQITINENQRHQLWECTGADEEGNHGKMRLLGTISEAATKSMSDPETLLAFIDYGAENYPAEKYDLICWDHGGGPAGGYALDNLDGDERAYMPLGGLVSAIRNSAVVQNTDQKKFEFIDFDACMMGNAEIVTALAPYTDYFIGSAEVEPPYGHEYTTWLNKLYEDPDIDGYALGREIVDAFDAFYSRTGEEWYGSRATLAVVNTQNFLTRMLPCLKEMTGILRSEIFEKGTLNNKYNYYDETITALDSIYYSKEGEGLIDIGDFARCVGICLTELDNEASEDEDTYANRYTHAAVELVRIMQDQDFSGDDVIYAKSSQSMGKKVKYRLQRDDKGEVILGIGTIVPGGLSFFLGSSLGGLVPQYVKSLNEVCESLDTSDPAWGFFDDLKKIALGYAIAMESGRIISELSCQNQEINLDTVMEELSGPYSKLDEHIRLAKEERLDNIEKWISEVISQQASEVIREENISVEAVRTSGRDASQGYYVSLSDSSIKIVDNVKLQMLVGFPGEEEPERMLKLGVFIGVMAEDMLLPGLKNGDEQPMTAIYQGTSCVFDAELPGMDWYEMSYDGGRSIITLDQDTEDEIYRIPIKLIRRDAEDEEQAEYGALEAVIQPDDSLAILGYAEYTRTPQPTIPIDNDSLDGARIILTGTTLDGDGNEMYEDLSGLITLTEEKGRGLTIVKKPLAEIQGADASRIQAIGKVDDIYYHSFDITDKLREADRKAEAGEYRTHIGSSDVSIEVSDVTYNGQPQEPEVTVAYEGKTLKNGTDYEICYENNVETGTAIVVVFGIGNYCGMNVQTFTIMPIDVALSKD